MLNYQFKASRPNLLVLVISRNDCILFFILFGTNPFSKSTLYYKKSNLGGADEDHQHLIRFINESLYSVSANWLHTSWSNYFYYYIDPRIAWGQKKRYRVGGIKVFEGKFSLSHNPIPISTPLSKILSDFKQE